MLVVFKSKVVMGCMTSGFLFLKLIIFIMCVNNLTQYCLSRTLLITQHTNFSEKISIAEI